MERKRKPNPSPPIRAMAVRSGLRAGGYRGCMDYCAQEYDRCKVSDLPLDVCNDREPVCQNACKAFTDTYY